MTRRRSDLFKMPNNIFDAHLTASELMVLAAVYSLRSRSVYKGKKYIKVGQSTIATLCGFKSVKTVSNAVNTLCRLGYIERVDRYYDDRKKLGTYVYTLPVVKGRDFFFVSRRFLKYGLKPAQARIYLFFCKCAESRTMRFWNSYNDICRALDLKRSAVIQTVRELLSVGLIKRFRVRKKDGSFSDNHYKVVVLKPPRRKIMKKKRRSRLALGSFGRCISKHTTKVNEHIYMIKQMTAVVKPKIKNFFKNRGSPKIYRSLYSTHFYSNRRKNKIKYYLKYRCNLGLYGGRKNAPGKSPDK